MSLNWKMFSASNMVSVWVSDGLEWSCEVGRFRSNRGGFARGGGMGLPDIWTGSRCSRATVAHRPSGRRDWW